MQALSQWIESLCQWVVLISPDHPRYLATLRDQILRCPADPGEAGTFAGAVTGALLSYLDRQSGSAPDALEGIHQVVSASASELQSVIVLGKPLASASLPAELELAGPPGAASGSAREPVAMQEHELLGDFIIEAKEHLESATAGLLALETQAGDPESLNAVFRAFHTIKSAAAYLELTEIHELSHEAETVLERARRKDLSLGRDGADLIFRAMDAMKTLLGGWSQYLATSKRPGSLSTLPNLLAELKAVGGVPPGALGSEEIPGGPGATPHRAGGAPEGSAGFPAAERPPSESAPLRETIRVDLEPLDRLITAVGELVIAEAMVAQSPELKSFASSTFQSHVTRVTKITRTLQELCTSLRLVPVGPLFLRVARALRDLSRKMEKPVTLTTQGEDVKVDKMIVDRVADPLLHVIRNALDHGLEPEAVRRALGKPPEGRIWLRAFHREGSIFVEVEDDGRGLDRGRIREKALEKGLIPPDQELSDREIDQLVFLPGFSTAEKVTEISGRGIGMDVVKRNVEALKGSVELESRKGQGCKVILRLPLTLATLEGMLVQVGQERYVVPMLSILRLVDSNHASLRTVLGSGEMLDLEGRPIPVHRLGRLLRSGALDAPGKPSVLLVVESEGKLAALAADGVLGQQQVVIKSLGEAIDRLPGIAGATILPDGRVGLILDIPEILSMAVAPLGRGGARSAEASLDRS